LGSRPSARHWPDHITPAEMGSTTDLHRRFVDNYEQGKLLSPEQSASSLLARLASAENSQIWEAPIAPDLTDHPKPPQGGQ
jgi:hypothetical protein